MHRSLVDASNNNASSSSPSVEYVSRITAVVVPAKSCLVINPYQIALCRDPYLSEESRQRLVRAASKDILHLFPEALVMYLQYPNYEN